MSIHTLLLFVCASFMIAIVPGPNVLLVISRAMTNGLSSALTVVTGLASAALIYLIATIAGFIAFVAAAPNALTGLRALGAGYLIYIGLKMMWTSLSKKSASTNLPPQSLRTSMYAQGFWASFSNPKTMLYWSAFLPQFVDHSNSIVQSMPILGIAGIVIEVVVLMGYATIAVLARRTMVSSQSTRILQTFSGAVLTILGLSLSWNLLNARRVI